jgi:molybdopterin-synthase adenylyltransferase
MMDITLGEMDWKNLQQRLTAGEVEHCAVLYAQSISRSDGTNRLLVREVEFAEQSDYATQVIDGAVLQPQFVARVTKRARRERLSLLFAHSHPGAFPPHFSSIDDRGESHLAEFLQRRHSEVPHAAIVVSAGGARARELGRGTPARIVSLGEERKVIFDPERSDVAVHDTFDRQVRAFGAQGQRALSALCVGIVGLGGTGSIIAQQLAHLGVHKFVLIDPDVIERSNLNRVVFATEADIGTLKVEVAARHIRSLVPAATVRSVPGDLIHARTARELIATDLIFGCTDSHGSRAVLQQVAYQYLIPCIDVGSTIITKAGALTNIIGRVQLLSPGAACFTCSGLLNPEEVRRDMMSAFERRLDPYIQGAHEPAPAVISLNGTVSSLAVTMFMAFVTGLPSRPRYLIYNAISGTLRSVKAAAQENCYICSPKGTYARGESQALYARQD